MGMEDVTQFRNKMCPADAARKADEKKVCNMIKSYIKAHTTEGSETVSPS